MKVAFAAVAKDTPRGEGQERGQGPGAHQGGVTLQPVSGSSALRRCAVTD